MRSSFRVDPRFPTRANESSKRINRRFVGVTRAEYDSGSSLISIEIKEIPFHSFPQTALNNLEEMQHNPLVYRSDNRSRSIGVGPMRSRPMEKRHDTSPYSGVPYLSPPPPDTWRRTNSDSALHQSANEACQSTSAIPHRRGSGACQFFFPSFFNTRIFNARNPFASHVRNASDSRFPARNYGNAP